MRLMTMRRRSLMVSVALGLTFALQAADPAEAQPVAVTLMQVQGAGHLSPFEGQNVTTTIAFNGGASTPTVGDLVQLTDTVCAIAWTGDAVRTEAALPATALTLRPTGP